MRSSTETEAIRPRADALRAAPGSSAPSSLLLWLAGALGDTLLACPALAAWRAHAPECHLTVVGRAPFSLAQRAGLLDRLIDVDGPLASALFAGRAPAHLAPPDAALGWSAAPDTVAAGLRAWGVGRVHTYPPRGPAGLHQAAYLLEGFAPLGLRADVPSSPVLQAATNGEVTTALPMSPGVLLHPGAGGRWKRWGLARFLEVAAALRSRGHTVWWSCGPADDDLRAALHAAGDGSALWPPLDLPGYARALERCSLLVSPDTGVAHLAALVGVPRITLFGPTDPARWRPLGPHGTVLRAPDRCGRSWDTQDGGRQSALRRCPPELGERCACLEALDVGLVLRACRDALP